MKLSDARNAKKVLPVKKKALDYDEDWHNRTGGFLPNNDKKEEKGFNKAIDVYNNVDFGGDVELLAKELYETMYGDVSLWESEVSNVEKDIFRRHAERLISKMPTWVVVRKGEYERD